MEQRLKNNSNLLAPKMFQAYALFSFQVHNSY
jgi:hypothetical protein